MLTKNKLKRRDLKQLKLLVNEKNVLKVVLFLDNTTNKITFYKLIKDLSKSTFTAAIELKLNKSLLKYVINNQLYRIELKQKFNSNNINVFCQSDTFNKFYVSNDNKSIKQGLNSLKVL